MTAGVSKIEAIGMDTRLGLILSLRSEGLSDAAIAAKLNLTRQRIGKIAGPSGRKPGPKADADMTARVRKLRAAGATYAEIRQLTGQSTANVHLILKRGKDAV